MEKKFGVLHINLYSQFFLAICIMNVLLWIIGTYILPFSYFVEKSHNAGDAFLDELIHRGFKVADLIEHLQDEKFSNFLQIIRLDLGKLMVLWSKIQLHALLIIKSRSAIETPYTYLLAKFLWVPKKMNSEFHPAVPYHHHHWKCYHWHYLPILD